MGFHPEHQGPQGRLMKHLLVVCMGNICRSPLAQAWFQSRLGENASVESAGIGALVGQPADPLAIEVGLADGLDLSGHRARQITPQMIRDADLVLVMEKRQRDHLIQLAPWATGKIWRIGHTQGQDVGDPYRLGRESFEVTYHTITSLGQAWLPTFGVP